MLRPRWRRVPTTKAGDHCSTWWNAEKQLGEASLSTDRVAVIQDSHRTELPSFPNMLTTLPQLEQKPCRLRGVATRTGIPGTTPVCAEVPLTAAPWKPFQRRRHLHGLRHAKSMVEVGRPGAPNGRACPRQGETDPDDCRGYARCQGSPLRACEAHAPLLRRISVPCQRRNSDPRFLQGLRTRMRIRAAFRRWGAAHRRQSARATLLLHGARRSWRRGRAPSWSIKDNHPATRAAAREVYRISSPGHIYKHPVVVDAYRPCRPNVAEARTAGPTLANERPPAHRAPSHPGSSSCRRPPARAHPEPRALSPPKHPSQHVRPEVQRNPMLRHATGSRTAATVTDSAAHFPAPTPSTLQHIWESPPLQDASCGVAQAFRSGAKCVCPQARHTSGAT